MCRRSLPFHRCRPQRAAVALLFATLLAATPANSQIVAGRAIDAGGGEPIGGVTITLADALAGTRSTVVSNDNGEFIIPISDPGMYLSRASRIGYATIETPSIEIGDREVV